MKEFKVEIIDAIVERAKGERIISLHEVGKSLGHKHIASQDCRDIMGAVLKQLPGYKPVKMISPGQSDATASLWTTLCFVDKKLEFCDGSEFEDESR